MPTGIIHFEQMFWHVNIHRGGGSASLSFYVLTKLIIYSENRQ